MKFEMYLETAEIKEFFLFRRSFNNGSCWAQSRFKIFSVLNRYIIQ